MKFFKNLYNEIDFFLRRNIRLSREYNGENEPKDDLFNSRSAGSLARKRSTAEEKEADYLENYRLHELKANSTRRNYLENLAVIELLENNITVGLDDPKILDIGSKNWFYAAGQYHFFKYNNSGEREILLDGIEIDAYRMYTDLHSRRDYALYYTRNLKNCRYITGDLLKHKGKYDCIVWFFPFVSEAPLIKWGLPLSVYKPAEMIHHASNLLYPGGIMLIVNQDEAEYTTQEALLKAEGLEYMQKGRFENSFLEFEHGRYVTVVKKPANTQKTCQNQCSRCCKGDNG
jgi:hypothetical protein